jgi:single-strand DNA-binding protein
VAQSFSKALLIGRLGQDPEVRYTPEGEALARFSLATDRPTAPGGVREADWHAIVCRGKVAEFVSAYLGKGRLVFVAGRLTYRTWEGRDGQRRRTAEVVASEVVPLDRRPEGGPAQPEHAEAPAAGESAIPGEALPF